MYGGIPIHYGCSARRKHAAGLMSVSPGPRRRAGMRRRGDSIMLQLLALYLVGRVIGVGPRRLFYELLASRPENATKRKPPSKLGMKWLRVVDRRPWRRLARSLHWLSGRDAARV